MTLTVRLDDTLESALVRYSSAHGVTKSHVVQEALADYLAKRQVAPALPATVSENYRAFERAGLVGCVAGDGRSATKEVVRDRIRQRLAAPALKPKPALLDTGVLVALHLAHDPKHAAAARWFAGFHGELHTVEPVLVETAFFLPPRFRAGLARLAASGRVRLHPVDRAGHTRIAELFSTYEDQNPDWADLALVWLAEASGIARIATLDTADFGVYRIKGRKRFEIELLP